MTKNLITARQDTPLVQAWSTMRNHGIRHLPVVNDAGEIIGILSDRDMQRAMTPPQAAQSLSENSVEFDPRFRVQEFMSWPVQSVLKSTSIEEVVRLVLSQKLSAFLVLDATGHCQGILTTDDLLKYLLSLLSKDPNRAKLGIGSVLEDSDHYSSFLT